MPKHLIGLTLIDAPYSALNNAGTEASQATENIVTVKKLQRAGILTLTFPGKHGGTGGARLSNKSLMNGKTHP